MRRLSLLAVIGLTALSIAHAGPAPGDLDGTFSGDGIATAFKTGSVANAVAIDHAGRSVVVGQTTDDHVDVAVARFLPDGSPDLTFGTNGRVRMPLHAEAAVAFDVAIADDDGLAIAGRRTRRAAEDSFVLRLDDAGEAVAAFGGDGLALVDFGKQESANAVAFADSGRIDLAGYVTNGTTERCAFARLDADGTLDPRFSGNGTRFADVSPGTEQINDLITLPGGDVVAAGYAETGTQPRFLIVHLRSSGAFAAGFGHEGIVRTDLGPGADVANAIARTGSGELVLAGSAANDGHRDWGVARYRADGSLDGSFGDAGVVILAWTSAPEAADDVLTAGRKLVIAGRIHRTATGDDAGVVRLRRGGKLDDTFGVGGVARVDVAGATDAAHGLARQASGKIVLAGETWVAGSPRFLVARLRAG
jgi:uncharacterized delta-60 repeat protein